jgi:hypothetical protein
MSNNKIERGGCRFGLNGSDGKPLVMMELFHDTVPRLAGITLAFEVLSGIKPEQTRKLVETMNDQIIGVTVIPK